MTFVVKFIPNDKGNPASKLADAELHFTGGPLDGLRLVGFSVWQARGGARTVTLPARQYSVQGERRSYALLRPLESGDRRSQDQLTTLILDAYAEFEREQAPAGARV
jgi:hypothetical protein